MNLRLLLLSCLAVASCKSNADPNALSQPWSDTFDRPELGADWKNTGAPWDVENGALHGQRGYNHPLWLNKTLPKDVRVEFDIWTPHPDGDLKVEVFGDGKTFDPDRGSYTASAYVFIFGGWKNTQSKIARMDEHRPADPSRTDVRVEPNRHYHWVIERSGGRILWTLDDRKFLEFVDDNPLLGPGHDHFAVGNWETPVYLDNLKITPL